MLLTKKIRKTEGVAQKSLIKKDNFLKTKSCEAHLLLKPFFFVPDLFKLTAHSGT